MWSEDTCQQIGDANKRLPVSMPIYIYCRAHIISNAASIISLQRMDSSSLASFFSANSSRVNQDVFFSLPAPAICVAKV